MAFARLWKNHETAGRALCTRISPKFSADGPSRVAGEQAAHPPRYAEVNDLARVLVAQVANPGFDARGLAIPCAAELLPAA